VAVIGAVGGDTVDVHVDGVSVRLDLQPARIAYESTLIEAIA